MTSIPHRKGNRKSMADELSKEMDLLLKNTFDSKKSKKNKNTYSTSSSNSASKSKKSSKSNREKSKSNYLPDDYNDNHNRYVSNESNEEYPYITHQEEVLNPYETESPYYTDNNQVYNNSSNNLPNNYPGQYEGGNYSISSNYYPYSNIPIRPEDSKYKYNY